MAAAIQARAGKNVGPVENASSQVAQKNLYKDLVLGNNTISDFVPPKGQKNTRRSLTVAPFLNPAGPSPQWFVIANESGISITVTVTYRWDGKAAELLPTGAYAAPGARTIVIASGGVAGFSGAALPLSGDVLPTDGPVTINVAPTVPLEVLAGKVTAFYAAEDYANRGEYYKRVALTGLGRVKLVENPKGLNLAPFSLLNLVPLAGFFVIDCDTVAPHVINWHIVDENGVTRKTLPSPAPAGVGPTAYLPLMPAITLPAGWSIEVSLAAPVSNPADPVIVIAQFQMADEGPASSQGGGAF